MDDIVISDFRHNPPEGYYYSFEEYASGVIRIWLHNTCKFDYNHGEETRTVWGFWKSKTNRFFAPKNSKQIGTQVSIKSTSKYTAMQINQTPLEACFNV